MPRRLTALTIVLALASATAWAQDKKFVCLDLQPKANLKLSDNFGRGFEGNHLKELATGEQFLADIKFCVGGGVIQLGSKALENMPGKVEGIAVNKKAAQLHIFHATVFGGGPNAPGTPFYVEDGTPIGEYLVRYDDKSTERIAIVYGEDVRDWFYLEGEKEPSRGKVAWQGANEFATQIASKLRLYVSSWKNPKPEQTIVNIDYVSKKEETVAAPFCVAITVEER